MAAKPNGNISIVPLSKHGAGMAKKHGAMAGIEQRVASMASAWRRISMKWRSGIVSGIAGVA